MIAVGVADRQRRRSRSAARRRTCRRSRPACPAATRRTCATAVRRRIAGRSAGARGEVRRGRVAVEHEPGPHHGEVRRRLAEHRGAVREMDERRPDAGRRERPTALARSARSARAPTPCRRRRRTRSARRRRATSSAVDAARAPRRSARTSPTRRARGASCRCRPSGARRASRPAARAAAASARAPSSVHTAAARSCSRPSALLARERAAEDDDRRREPGPAQLDALLDRGDAERRGARRRRTRARRDRAVAVGVRLHDRHHGHARADELAGLAAVVAQGREAHLGDAWASRRTSGISRKRGDAARLAIANRRSLAVETLRNKCTSTARGANAAPARRAPERA